MVGPSVTLQGATKVFALGGGRDLRALDGLDASVKAGGFVIVMGPNGSGKTTLLRVLDGSLVLDAGAAAVGAANGAPGSGSRIVHITQDPQSRTFGRLTMAEHFLLAELDGSTPGPFAKGVTARRRDRYREFLRHYDRGDLIDFLDRPVAELSGGMRQAVALLTTVVPTSVTETGRPVLMLLDEPTGALDSANETRCLDLVRRVHDGGATVVLVTHDPWLAARVGNDLLLMNRGQVARSFLGADKASLGAGDITQRMAELVAEVYSHPLPHPVG